MKWASRFIRNLNSVKQRFLQLPLSPTNSSFPVLETPPIATKRCQRHRATGACKDIQHLWALCWAPAFLLFQVRSSGMLPIRQSRCLWGINSEIALRDLIIRLRTANPLITKAPTNSSLLNWRNFNLISEWVNNLWVRVSRCTGQGDSPRQWKWRTALPIFFRGNSSKPECPAVLIHESLTKDPWWCLGLKALLKCHNQHNKKGLN